MQGRARWGHVLKVELANLSTKQPLILSMFSGIAGKGRALGLLGTGVLIGQAHGTFSPFGLEQPEDNERRSR